MTGLRVKVSSAGLLEDSQRFLLRVNDVSQVQSVLFFFWNLLMFDSAMIATLESVAQALETTCDEVLSYLNSQHWQVSLDHGATKNYNDIVICMEDYLESV